MTTKQTKEKRAENEVRVTSLVNEFKEFAGKSADNYLEMARIVHEAKKLGKVAYFNFKRQVLFMNTGTSTFRKLEVVGSKITILQMNRNKLPANWTTIYMLSTLESADLEMRLKSGDIHPKLLGKDAKVFVGNLSKSRKKPEAKTVPNGTNSIRIGFVGLNDQTQIQAVKNLLNKLKSYNVQVESLDILDELLIDATPAVAANDSQTKLVA